MAQGRRKGQTIKDLIQHDFDQLINKINLFALKHPISGENWVALMKIRYLLENGSEAQKKELAQLAKLQGLSEKELLENVKKYGSVFDDIVNFFKKIPQEVAKAKENAMDVDHLREAFNNPSKVPNLPKIISALKFVKEQNLELDSSLELAFNALIKFFERLSPEIGEINFNDLNNYLNSELQDIAPNVMNRANIINDLFSLLKNVDYKKIAKLEVNTDFLLPLLLKMKSHEEQNLQPPDQVIKAACSALKKFVQEQPLETKIDFIALNNYLSLELKKVESDETKRKQIIEVLLVVAKGMGYKKIAELNDLNTNSLPGLLLKIRSHQWVFRIIEKTQYCTGELGYVCTAFTSALISSEIEKLQPPKQSTPDEVDQFVNLQVTSRELNENKENLEEEQVDSSMFLKLKNIYNDYSVREKFSENCSGSLDSIARYCEVYMKYLMSKINEIHQDFKLDDLKVVLKEDGSIEKQVRKGFEKDKDIIFWGNKYAYAFHLHKKAREAKNVVENFPSTRDSEQLNKKVAECFQCYEKYEPKFLKGNDQGSLEFCKSVAKTIAKGFISIVGLTLSLATAGLLLYPYTKLHDWMWQPSPSPDRNFAMATAGFFNKLPTKDVKPAPEEQKQPKPG